MLDGGIGDDQLNGGSGNNTLTNGPDIPVTTAGSALLAKEAGAGDAYSLREEDLAAIVDGAMVRWADSDAGEAAGSGFLDGVTVEIRELPGLMLGQAVGQRVIIDCDAAHHGWFIDPTPNDDAEFASPSAGGGLVATADEADRRIDLLTVISHELGHVLGFEHEADEGLMAPSLAAGTRLMPETDLAKGAVTSTRGGGPEVETRFFDAISGSFIAHSLGDAAVAARSSDAGHAHHAAQVVQRKRAPVNGVEDWRIDLGIDEMRPPRSPTPPSLIDWTRAQHG